MMDQLMTWLQPLADLLARLGVAEDQTSMFALGLIFLLATLVVLLLILVVLRRRKTDRPTVATKIAPPAGTAAVEVAETAAVVDVALEPQDEGPAPVAEPGVESGPEPEPELPSAPAVVAEPVSLFQRMRQGLSKTQAGLIGRIDGLIGGQTRVDAGLLEDLEEVLITADLGMQTTQSLLRAIEQRLARNEASDPRVIREVLQEEISGRLAAVDTPLDLTQAQPMVVMVVGVNGVGKTTTIGKLARLWSSEGKKVVLGAGDTFRAAAAEQLAIWGERSGVDVIRHAEGADPAAVAFDAARAAVARKADILLLDTAGRLHTKSNLMEELKKVHRVLAREIPGAPHETLLVLDATTGQNALVQARLFKETVNVTGLALTKLDGTARGGIIISIANDLALPVRFVGIGEGADDLRPFDPELFVRALFEKE
jgi:fused signal recognition particle receptor